MTDEHHEIRSYKGVGPYRLGMSQEECAAAAGPADRVRNNLPMKWVHEHRGAGEKAIASDGRARSSISGLGKEHEVKPVVGQSPSTWS